MFDEYITELKKIKLLSPTDEHRLWVAYKDGDDQDARRKLIEHYQPLVFKAVMKWRGTNDVMMDLVQEGTVGLIEATESYCYERGVAFSLYAGHRIRGRIVDYLRKEGQSDCVSVDEVGEEFEAYLTDQSISTAMQAEQNYLVGEMMAALKRLPDREQAVLHGVYLADEQPKEVAQKLNVSPAHVYRLQKQGLRRIRGIMSRLMHELKQY